MSASLTWSVFAFGILLLAAAFFVPAMIDNVSGDQHSTVDIDTNSSLYLADYLNMTLSNTNTTAVNETATVRFEQTKDLINANLTVNETEAANTSLDGDTINVTATDVRSNGSTMNINYPAMIGWNSAARTFMEQLGNLFALLGLMSMLSAIYWGLRQ